MADLAGFIADAGVAAGSAGSIKARADQGASKDQADLTNEHGEDFEQLVAGGDKARSGEEAKANPDAGKGRARPVLRAPGAGWYWPDGRAVGAVAGDGKVSEKGQPEVEDAPAEPLLHGQRAALTAASLITEPQPREGKAKANEDQNPDRLARREKPNTADGTEVRGRVALETSNNQGQFRGIGSTARGGNPLEGSPQSALSEQAVRTTPQTSGVAMQPGMVEPAAVQLAAVLAKGSEAGKGADGARGTAEAPKMQVSLAETHFSPVKPDSELEAYDLVRRMDGVRPAEEFGRSLRDSLRGQGEARSERSGRSSVSQRDVRAEQLVQNISRVPVPGDIGGQIGTRILQELEPSRTPAEVRSAGTVQVKQSDPVLKVLEIRLEPRELGTVLVRMSLRDNVLQVELGFGKSDAAATIAKNTDQLTQYLRSSGYVVDDIVVRIIDGDRLPAPVVSTNTGSDLGQGGAGSSTGSGSSSASGQAFDEGNDRRQSAQDGQSARENSGEGSHGQDSTMARSDSGLFV
jgi:chemotaxis protein MotD